MSPNVAIDESEGDNQALNKPMSLTKGWSSKYVKDRDPEKISKMIFRIIKKSTNRHTKGK